MNPRDIHYGSSFNWCFSNNPNAEINYNTENPLRKSNEKVISNDEPSRNSASNVHSKKHVISSEKLAKKLYTEHGIKPVFHEHTQIPLDKFAVALSEEININQTRDDKFRQRANHEYRQRYLSAEQRNKSNWSGAGRSFGLRTNNSDRECNGRTKPFQNLSRQNARQLNRVSCPIILTDSKEIQDESLGAEIRRTTELTKNFVASQISKVKDFFSLVDTSGKVERNAEKSGVNNKGSKQPQNYRKNSLITVCENRKCANATISSILTTRILGNVSNRGTLQKDLVSKKGPHETQTLREEGKTPKLHNFTGSNHNSEKFKGKHENSSTSRNESRNNNNSSRSSRHCTSSSTQKRPAIDGNGSRSIKVVDDKNRVGENETSKCSPRTSETRSSSGGWVIDLCHGSEMINVVPGSLTEGDTFSSDALKKHKRLGSYLLARDTTTGGRFRLDIPDKLFNAQGTAPFASKPALVNFIVQVLNEPSVDFVPLNNFPGKFADFWAIRPNGTNGPPKHQFSINIVDKKQRNSANKTIRNTKNPSTYLNTESETNKDSKDVSTYFSNRNYSEAGQSRFGSKVLNPCYSKDIIAKPCTDVSQINCTTTFPSSTDVSTNDSQTSNIKSENLSTSNESSSVSCNESHCLNYKLDDNDTKDIVTDVNASCIELRDGICANALLATSHRPVTKTSSSSSKIRYKMYYHTTDTKSRRSKTRIANGQHFIEEKRKSPIIKMQKIEEDVLARKNRNSQANKQIQGGSNRDTTSIIRQNVDVNVDKKFQSLSISYPLTFDNKNNVFSFKEEPSCPLAPMVASEEFHCPLYVKSSRENLMRDTDSACSWSSHVKRSVRNAVSVARKSGSSSSWKTVVDNKISGKVRISRNVRGKRKSWKSERKKRDLNLINTNGSKVIENKVADIRKEHSVNQDVAINDEKNILSADFNRRLRNKSSSDMMMYLKYSSQNLNRCHEDTKMVVMAARLWSVLNYLSRISPVFRLIASNPLLGEVILLTYATIFGSTIENDLRLKNALSNSVICRDLIQRRHSI